MNRSAVTMMLVEVNQQITLNALYFLGSFIGSTLHKELNANKKNTNKIAEHVKEASMSMMFMN